MRLRNKRVGVFVEEGFEDLEFWVPVMRLREEGAQVTIIGSGRADGFRGKHCLEAQPDVTADQVSAGDLMHWSSPGDGHPTSCGAYRPSLIWCEPCTSKAK